MKKKFAKLAVLICTLALALTCGFALVACGGDNDGDTTTTYAYSETKLEDDNGAVENPAMTNMYDTLYKNSTVAVNNSKVVWTVGGQENAMNVTKDGEKYKLSGDYVETVKNTFTALFGEDEVEFEMYGIKTESGFNLEIAQSHTDADGQKESMLIKICFINNEA